jgi:hypothetical protein
MRRSTFASRSFPVERAALGSCDLSVLHVGRLSATLSACWRASRDQRAAPFRHIAAGEWQWLVRQVTGRVEDDPRLSRLYNRFGLQVDRSITNAERAANRKLVRSGCLNICTVLFEPKKKSATRQMACNNASFSPFSTPGTRVDPPGDRAAILRSKNLTRRRHPRPAGASSACRRILGLPAQHPEGLPLTSSCGKEDGTTSQPESPAANRFRNFRRAAISTGDISGSPRFHPRRDQSGHEPCVRAA